MFVKQTMSMDQIMGEQTNATSVFTMTSTHSLMEAEDADVMVNLGTVQENV